VTTPKTLVTNLRMAVALGTTQAHDTKLAQQMIAAQTPLPRVQQRVSQERQMREMLRGDASPRQARKANKAANRQVQVAISLRAESAS
jgi:hypothetical protein